MKIRKIAHGLFVQETGCCNLDISQLSKNLVLLFHEKRFPILLPTQHQRQQDFHLSLIGTF